MSGETAADAAAEPIVVAGSLRPPTDYSRVDLTALDALPQEVRSRDVLYCAVLTDLVADRWCYRAALAFDFEPGKPLPRRPDSVRGDRVFVWDWVLRRLTAQGLLRRIDPDTVELLTPHWDDAALDQTLADLPPSMTPMVELFRVAGEAYPAFLRGEVDGEDVLVSPTALPLWDRFFSNTNINYGPVNRLVADYAKDQIPGEGLRVLEVGGGFGSGAELTLPGLGDRLGHYTFSERVPFFLAKGKAKLSRAFPDAPLSFERHDIEKPLPEQGVEAGSIDLVVANNVLHAVEDLRGALGNLRQVLKPRGHLLLGETYRPEPDFTLAVEFIFQLTKPFREVVVEPELRPAGGFLSHNSWRKALAACGFADVTFWPTTESVAHIEPPYCFAAIHGIRGE